MSRAALAPVNVPWLAADPTTPTLRAGDLYANSGTSKLRLYTGAAWADVAAAGGGGSGTPATTVASETTYGIASAVGVSANYAREDHTHGSPLTPVTSFAGRTGAVTPFLADIDPGAANFNGDSTTEYAFPGACDAAAFYAASFTSTVTDAPSMTTYGRPVAHDYGFYLRGATAATATYVQQVPKSLQWDINYWTGSAAAIVPVYAQAYVTAASGTTELYLFASSVRTSGTLSEGANRVYSAGNPPPYPVTTVAGRTGAIVLSASDVVGGPFPVGGSYQFRPTGSNESTYNNRNSFGQELQITPQAAATATALNVTASQTWWFNYWTGTASAQGFVGIKAGARDATGAPQLSVGGVLNALSGVYDADNRVYSAMNTNLASTTPAAVAAAGSAGAATTYAHSDHVHSGVTSVAGGTGITVSAASGAVTITRTALTAADIAAGTHPVGAFTFQPTGQNETAYGNTTTFTPGISITPTTAATATNLVVDAGITFGYNYWNGTASVAGNVPIKATALTSAGVDALVVGGQLYEQGNRVYSAGNANLSAAVPAAVATAGAVGTATTYARGDHVHSGVTSVAAGSGITVSAASGAVTITRAALTAADVPSTFPQGIVQRFSNAASTAAITTATSVFSSTVTQGIVNGRFYKVSFFCFGVSATVATDNFEIDLTMGSATALSPGAHYFAPNRVGNTTGLSISAIFQATATTTTAVLNIQVSRQSGTGTVTLLANAANPLYAIIEDIGA